jgi:hypothetical protein
MVVQFSKKILVCIFSGRKEELLNFHLTYQSNEQFHEFIVLFSLFTWLIWQIIGEVELNSQASNEALHILWTDSSVAQRQRLPKSEK